jgi:hypothetical protein
MAIRRLFQFTTGILILVTTITVHTIGLGDPPVGGSARSRSAAETNGPIAVKVTTDKKSYASGDSIVLTMTVRNTGKVAQTLDFSSTQKFDFEVRKGGTTDGALVWQWSRGMMFGQIVTSVPLAVGATQTYSATAGPKGHNGSTVPALAAGTYTVVGTLTTMPRTARPFGTTTFTVK